MSINQKKRKINNKFFSINHSSDRKIVHTNRSNKNKEIVYRLNFKNDGLIDLDNETEKLKMTIYNQYPKDKINPQDLYTSIERVKTFFPKISNILENAKNENIEKVIYQRFKNQEYENLLKKKIKDISLEKEILNIKMNEYIVDLHKKENEIADKQITINNLNENNFNLTYNKINYSLNKSNILNKHIGTPDTKVEYLKTEENIKKNNNQNNKNKRSTIIKTNNKIDEFTIRTLQNRAENIKDINANLEILKIEKDKILKKINNLELQKEQLRIKKRSLIQELYKHYLEILKIGKDTRNEGLSWVIKEIFLLRKKVLLTYFPDFLDHLCKIFLFHQAKIRLDLDEVNNKIKKVKQELFDKGFFNDDFIKDSNKRDNIDNLNKSETDNSMVLNNLSKDISDIENKNIKNLILLGNKNNKNNNNLYLKSMFNLGKKQEIRNNTYKNNQKRKNYNIKNISNTNYQNFIEKYKNNTSFSDLNESIHSKIKLKDHNYLKNSDINDSTANSTNYNTINKYKEKDMIFTSYNDIPEVIKLSEFEAYLKNKKPESKIISNDIADLVQDYQKYSKKQKNLKKKQDEMKKNEMDRIFNEYLRNNYYQRYKVEKNVVLSALIGEDNINNELNKQIKRAKKFFDNAKSYSLGHKRVNKKIYKFDKSSQLKLKTMVGDTFLGSIY